MNTTTVSSAYGELPLKTTEFCRYPLPRLQFDSGDVLIKLSSDPDDCLLVHSVVLGAGSPVFRASFRDTWSASAKLDIVAHPATGVTVAVRTLALKRLDGTYFLEGKDVDSEQDDTTVCFQNSSYVQPGWPQVVDDRQSLESSRRALRIFIALLYGAELHRYGIWNLNRETFDMVVTFCAYTEFYGCLHTIQPAIIGIMQSAPGYWTAVADEPSKHIVLAKKLQDTQMYFDGFRHLVAQAHSSGRWEDVEEATDNTYSKSDLRDFCKPQLESSESKASQLEIDLLKLQLHEIDVFHGGWYKTFTSFFETLKTKFPGRSNQARVIEHAGFIGRSIWGEHVLLQLYGDKLISGVTAGRPRAGKAGRLNLLVLRIESASNVINTAHIFGTSTPARFAAMFKLDHAHELQIQRCPQHLVRRADDIIKEAFPVTGELVSGQLGGVTKDCIFGRATFDAQYSGYFTYMKVPFEVPWESTTQMPLNREAEFSLPAQVSVAAALKEWIRVLLKSCTGREQSTS